MEGLGKRVTSYLAIAIVVAIIGAGLYAWQKHTDLLILRANQDIAKANKDRDRVMSVLQSMRDNAERDAKVMKAALFAKDKAESRADVYADSIKSLHKAFEESPHDSTTASDSVAHYKKLYELSSLENSNLRVSMKAMEAYARLVESDRNRWNMVADSLEQVTNRSAAAFEKYIKSKECYILPGVKCLSRGATAAIAVVGFYFLDKTVDHPLK